MKILLVSFLYEAEIGGGAAVVVNQLANSLVSANHEVVILTSWEGKQVKTDHNHGIKIIRIPAFNIYWVYHKDTQPFYKKVVWQLIDAWNPWVYRVCREIFIAERPDVVHVHKLRGLSPSVWSAASAAGIKRIVHTCHDYEVLSPEGLLMGRVGKLAREQNILLRPYQSLRRTTSKLVNAVTFPSAYAQAVHLNMGFFGGAEKRVVPNSHGLSRKSIEEKQASSHYAAKKAIHRFLYIGRLDKAKGIEILCEAFLQLANQHQDAVLQIAGWGPLDKPLKAKYGGFRSIHFLGPVFGERKEEIFNGADVLVVPSLAAESFGIVIAEGFAHGLPAVVTRVGAFPEIVNEGYTGYLADPDSVGRLYDALLKISSAVPLAIEMSGNCFEEAFRYSTETLLENYLSIY